MSDTHTHRGHCQYCLRLIAIDVQTGYLAKHGYTVRGGMFLGECPGSDILSLHTDRSHTDRVIVMYQEKAERLAREHADMVAGRLWPSRCYDGKPRYETHTSDDYLVKYWTFVTEKVVVSKTSHGGKTIQVETEQSREIPWADANEFQRRRALIIKIRELDDDAKSSASFAKTMKRWAKEVYDDKMPAYRVKDLEEWAKVGDTVRAGGEKNGFDAKVEAVEMRPYTTRGWLRGGSNTVMTQHVRITRPAIANTYHKNGSIKKKGREARTYWDAVRNVRPAEDSIMAKLKADDLL